LVKKGTQFRCKELNYYYFTFLASQGICVNSNYLGEKHGKFGRDQHFSVISYYLRKESFKNLIANTNDIANTINSCQNQSNIHRRTQLKQDIEVFAFVLNPSINESYKKHTRLIADITSFYNLQNIVFDNEYFLNSTVYSDLKDFIDPRFLNSVIDEERGIVNFQGPQQIEPEQLNIDSHLKHKRQTIEIFLQSATKTPSRSVSINNINNLANNSSPSIPVRSLSFSTNLPSTSYQNESMINPSSSIEPIFCNRMCKNCKVSPLYSIEQLKTINGNRRLVGQLKLNEELSNHGHPKSRKMPNNKLRNTEQTLEELLEHYKFFHNLF
jgi:hypothetical protein